MQIILKYRFRILVIGLVFALHSCRPKAVVVAETAATNNEIPATQIIDKYRINDWSFSTLNIKASVKYEDTNMSQNVTADIRMKKDEKIMVIIRVLGITMAKALITPDAVRYYEKPGNSFFEGDYSALSRWLGTELDFQKVQNLFLGKTIDDLSKGRYIVSIENQWYRLNSADNPALSKAYYFEGENYLVKRQEINQPNLQRTLQVSYPEYRKTDEKFLPLQMLLEAQLEAEKTTINVEYKHVNFNEELSFPYSVPEGFERVAIDKK